MGKARERLRNLFRRNKRRKTPPPEEPQPPPDNLENFNEKLPMKADEGEMKTYFHVGLLAKMCLIHGYNNGPWKLQTTSKTEGELFLSTFGEGYPSLNDAYGGVEAYQEIENFYTSLAWLTDSLLCADIAARGEAFEGKGQFVLKNTFGLNDDNKFEFQCKCKLDIDRNPIRMELEVPIYKEPLLLGYLTVTPAENFILGCRGAYDWENKKQIRHALCAGYQNETTEVSLKLENFKEVRGSIFQKIGEQWAVALKANLCGEEVAAHKIMVGCQYEFEPGHMLKARVRGDTYVGLVYQKKLREDIEMMLHGGIEARDPLNGNYSIGTSWYFNLSI
ncbi:hypothetical protein KR067_010260 [Drosophila pandora]|nr:hypothetical protein KR067_010260 [Drosophila pandora]